MHPIGKNPPSPKPLYAGTVFLAVVLIAFVGHQRLQIVQAFKEKGHQRLLVRVEGFSIAQRALIEASLTEVLRVVRYVEQQPAPELDAADWLATLSNTLIGISWLSIDGTVLHSVGQSVSPALIASAAGAALPTALPALPVLPALPALLPGEADWSLLLFLDAQPARRPTEGARYVVAIIDAKRFGTIIETLGAIPGTSVGVTTPEGRVVMRRPVSVQAPAVVASARVATDRTFRETSPFDGLERLVSLRVSDNWSLRIAVTADLAPVDAEIAAFRRTTTANHLVVGAFVLGLVGIVGYLAWQHIRAAKQLRHTIRRSERIRARLAADEELFRALFETATISIIIRDQETGAILEANRCAIESYGLPTIEALRGYARYGDPPFSGEDEQRWLKRARTKGPQRFEWLAVRADGSTFWEDVFLHSIDLSGQRRFVAIAIDVTDRHRVEEKMRHLAQHDPLTGLPNRALFSDRLRQAITMAARTKDTLALLFVDLDNFKPINDTHGHEAGDAVLCAIAARLRKTIRASDTVGRIGGDEFVVLLPNVDDPHAATAVAKKALVELSAPIEHGGSSLQISASIGIAIHPQHGGSDAELMRNADTAMYAAKQAGRNRVQVFGGS